MPGLDSCDEVHEIIESSKSADRRKPSRFAPCADEAEFEEFWEATKSLILTHQCFPRELFSKIFRCTSNGEPSLQVSASNKSVRQLH